MAESSPFQSKSDEKERVLACMDSGVGGLAVLRRFVEKMPDSAFVFIGDTLWMPYGEKPVEDIQKRVLAIHHWLESEYKPAVFVLACNTATVAAYEDLIAKQLPYPVLEPVKSTAEWVNKNIDKHKKIGVLATPATASTGRYRQFLDSKFPVTEVACKGLASVVEKGICNGPELDAVLLPYLEILKADNVDVVISGCTHYSFILDEMQEVMGSSVQIVDSSDVLAEVAMPVLEKLSLAKGRQEIVVTGPVEDFKTAVSKLPLSILSATPISQITVESAISALS